jgi:two-component system, OmpR family, response regulator
MRVLLIEDEPEMARALGVCLGRSGFIADQVGGLEEARAAMQCYRYTLALVDRRLPDGEGLELVPELKRSQPGIRVLVLTAFHAVSDRIAGLDAGADDYLAKPFDLDELMARIRACLRRSDMGSAPPAALGALSFDFATHQVRVDGVPLVLHRRELALLEALMRHAGRLILRDQLLEEVYGFDDEVQMNALNILVSRLRKKLDERNAGVEIHAARGIGYMLTKAAPL